MRSKLFFCLIVLFLFSFAYAVNEFPSYVNKYVNDFANVLDDAQKQELHTAFSNIDAETTAEVVFVSVETSEPYTPQEYRTKLFNEWKVGKSDKDNGLLILYSLKEKRIEVEVGYGLEGILPDSKVGRMLDEYYVPLRNVGNVSLGIIDFSKAISQEILKNKEEVLSGKARGDDTFNLFFLILIGIFVFFIVWFVKIKSNMKPTINRKNDNTDGIKKDKTYRSIVSWISIIGGFILIYLGYFVLGVLLFFALPAFLHWLRGMRCAKDGLKMKYAGKDGKYKLYRCPNGHTGKMLIAAMTAFYFGGRRHGGFSGGGFSGGGFGGGGSGGGGAGR